MEIILWIGFYFLTFYAFLPALVSRIFGFRVFMKGQSKSEVSLTFDDGPDPVYTPKLLDLLKRHGAKGTFFVVGENAERNPELIARIHEEGHILGIHNYVHHTNWLMRPRTVKRQIHRTSDVIKRITGSRPMYYRPPWGIVNVFDYANLGYLQIVLWTSLFGDWRKKVGADKLYKRMKQKLRPGEVFLLHDCGITFGADRDAPANTLSALERILDDGRELGYRFVGIDEMITITERAKKKGKPIERTATRRSSMSNDEQAGDNAHKVGPLKKLVVSLWMLYEKGFHIAFRLRPIGEGHFFNYRIRRYSGPPLDLQGDQTLRSGDRIMEIHFENQMLFDLGMNSKSTLQIGIRIIREMQNALPDMARELAKAPHGDEVKALYGVSMIHRGADSLGYETFELPRGLFSWMTNIYLRILIRVIHPAGNQRVRDKGDSMNPRMLIMTREMLLSWADESSPRKRRPVRSAKANAGKQQAENAAETAADFEETTIGELV
ncbi:polysaccharide deacetylase family protein [Cohnella lupini]|uniref:Peptidoglycan/xylan/chitin deacetylase (PgdA/CDA1 family) n=1 Tax=Cohnella lupini TaxID=1294267 RepID=A0A3D9IV19_9BACL|nr:polysaccharide deacetylase family protein [Cohnella lupini]RED65628.1 peptidoglycan/xylan/chitin deacetylase (PgdA/CDA1 family) [Cohnella lupini]